MVHVTAFFAGLLAFVYIGLAVIVIRNRYSSLVALGDGGDSTMNRKIRAHANFAEYVPLILVLMALNELNGRPKGVLVALGIAIVAGRLAHAYSLIVREVAKPNDYRFRMFGMVMTFGTLAILALMAIF